ncbi:MAG: type II toxin-antitoxin system Phd/YefM family antitoxin [Burkholderiaceae bacterium]|nr:type II toxin-antitoxin system Phd/YefM family antitoxin [Burkholderiaceae bacterium]
MESIKVGIREFRSQLPHYLLEVGQPIAITRHGETIGYYIPSRDKTTQDDRDALKAAAQKLDAMLQSAGVDSEALVEEFKTRRRKPR